MTVSPFPGERVDVRMPVLIKATPFVWIDPKDIPPRAWIYGRHYVRKFLSTTVAPSGIGKSSLTVPEILAICTGRALLDIMPDEQTNVWLWNGEDPKDELDRRIMSAAVHYGLEAGDLAGRLFVDTGRSMKIVIAEQTKSGTVIARPVVDAMIQNIRDNDIGLTVIDPFISCHGVAENDNPAIQAVADAWAEIADVTNSAIELVHHTRKTGGAEVSVDDGRGASALLAKARSARVINGMTKEEAEGAGVKNCRLYFRCENGKSSMSAPAENANWYRFASFDMGNGPASAAGQGGDSVGVVTAWEWPNPLDGVCANDILAVQNAVAAGKWRENSQAKDWVGKAAAAALKLDVADKAHKKRIIALMKVWTANGMFVLVTGKDEKRNDRAYVEVGEWATV